jgi:hypothetical protein
VITWLVVQSEMIDHTERVPARRQDRSSQLFVGKTFEDAEDVVSLPFEGIQQSPSLFVHPENRIAWQGAPEHLSPNVARGGVSYRRLRDARRRCLTAGSRSVTTVAGCERAELVGLPC